MTLPSSLHPMLEPLCRIHEGLICPYAHLTRNVPITTAASINALDLDDNISRELKLPYPRNVWLWLLIVAALGKVNVAVELTYFLPGRGRSKHSPEGTRVAHSHLGYGPAARSKMTPSMVHRLDELLA